MASRAVLLIILVLLQNDQTRQLCLMFREWTGAEKLTIKTLTVTIATGMMGCHRGKERREGWDTHKTHLSDITVAAHSALFRCLHHLFSFFASWDTRSVAASIDLQPTACQRGEREVILPDNTEWLRDSSPGERQAYGEGRKRASEWEIDEGEGRRVEEDWLAGSLRSLERTWDLWSIILELLR